MAESDCTTLTTPETISLSEHEAVIERGLQGFIEVGEALLGIRDGRLYRATHGTFDDYCRERWGMGRHRAAQLINASEVATGLVTIVTTPPANEAQARPLTKLPTPEAQQAAWQEAVDTAPAGRVTAAHVESVVQRHTAPPVPETAKGMLPLIDLDDDEEPTYQSQAHPTLDRVMEPAQAHPARRTEDRQTWATPQALFDVLDAEFHFTLDPCATPETAKCERYFTTEDDGLSKSWANAIVFCNPPYGDKDAWVRKAYTEAAEDDATVVLLIPCTPDTALWWDFCRKGEVRFIRGRLRFDDAGGAAPFPSALVIFWPGVRGIDCVAVWWDGWSASGGDCDV